MTLRGHLRNLTAVIIVTGLLAACGGGGGSTGGGGTGGGGAAPAAISVLSPGSVAVGGQLFLKGDAGYSNGTHVDITLQANWQSSNPSVAIVEANTGRMVGVSEGTTTVTASYSGQTASQVIRVGHILQTIQIVLPENTLVPIATGAELPLQATGQYTDRAVDVAELVTWATSDPSIAVVDNTPGHRGVIRGVAAGRVNISATLEGITQRVAVEVLMCQMLDSRGGEPAFGVDGSGRGLAVWSFPFAASDGPDLAFATSSPSGTWSTRGSVRDPRSLERTSGLRLAVAENGMAIAVWQAVDGVRAAVFGSDRSWSAPVLLSPFPSTGFTQGVWVTVDSAGNGLVTWQLPGSAGGFSGARFNASTALWTGTGDVTGAATTFASNVAGQLVSNRGGQAALVWVRWPAVVLPPGTQPTTDILVARFDHSTGWQPAEVVSSLSSVPGVTASFGDGGDMIVAWTGVEISNPTLSQVGARRYTPGTGWEASRILVAGSSGQQQTPAVAVNAQGAALLLWMSGADDSVSSSYRDPLTGFWSAPGSIYAPGAAAAGTPVILKPFIAADGRAVATFLIDDLGRLGKLMTVRRLPTSGFEAPQIYSFVGRRGAVSSAAIAYNAAGQGGMVWKEGSGPASGLFGYAALGRTLEA